jgi:hypothetical protein
MFRLTIQDFIMLPGDNGIVTARPRAQPEQGANQF